MTATTDVTDPTPSDPTAPPAALEPKPDPPTAVSCDGAEQKTEKPDSGERLVPVSESIRYRRRAQAAEQQLQSLREQFQQVQSQLDQTRSQLEATERRQRVDQLLIESQVIDLEAARLLTEATVAQLDSADLEEVVADLKRRKPYLFGRTEPISGGPLSPRLAGETIDLEDAAHAAATTGDRRDLLRYLRLRRNPH